MRGTLAHREGRARDVTEKLEELGVGTDQAVPAWCRRQGRTRWGTTVTWEAVKGMPVDEVVEVVQSQAVTEEHARKVRSVLAVVAAVAGGMPGRSIEEVGLAYLANVAKRPRVHRSSTVMWHWRVLQALWPRLRHSREGWLALVLDAPVPVR